MNKNSQGVRGWNMTMKMAREEASQENNTLEVAEGQTQDRRGK